MYLYQLELLISKGILRLFTKFYTYELNDSSHNVIINVDERQNSNRARRRLQGIDANIRRPITAPVTLSCRAFRCVNSLPVSTITIKEELIKQTSMCDVTGSGENLEFINDSLLEYKFLPDRKYDQELCALIPPQPIVVKGKDNRLECDICILDYKNGQKVRHLPCGHIFHRECIDKWLANAETCPKCRKHVVKGLRLLVSRKEHRTTRKHPQSSVNLPSSSISHSENSNSISITQRQNVPASLPVKQNRTSILRQELARSRRESNIETGMSPSTNVSVYAHPRTTLNSLRQTPAHCEETLPVSNCIAPVVEKFEGSNLCNEAFNSKISMGKETSNQCSAKDPRQKAAEAAFQRYEQFQKQTD